MFVPRVAFVAVFCLAAHPVAAQLIDPTVGAAETARTHWRAAVRATTDGDPRAALAQVSLAAHAFPSQSAYWLGLARLAAQAGDSTALSEAMRTLGAMRLGQPLLRDTVLTRVAPASSVAWLRTASADVKAGRVVATILDTTVFAEGIDADVKTGQLFVASIRLRTVLEVSRDGHVRDLQIARNGGVGAVLGVRVAADHVHLWITTSGIPQTLGYAPADSSIAALLQIRRRDGRIVRRIDIPADARGHVLGDLTIGSRGDVFVTDSKAPWLYRLRPGADTVERFTHPLFRSLQGVAASPDGAALYVADYSHGLLQIALSTGLVTRVADAPGSSSLGLDGIVLHGGAIIAVQNGVAPARIMRYVLAKDGARIVSAERLDQQPDADEPTIGTIRAGAFVYVANSQWDKFDDNGTRRPGTTLAPTRLIAVPLPPIARRPVRP